MASPSPPPSAGDGVGRVDAAKRAVAEVLGGGCRPEALEVLRVGTAVVVADPGRGVVARFEDRDGGRRAERQAAVARLLEEAGVPAVRLFGDDPGPTELEPGVKVVLWHREDLTGGCAGVVEIADLARRLHAVELPPGASDFALPAFDPLAATLGQLEDAPGPDDDVEALRAVARAVDAVWPGTDAGRVGVVHGDLHAGNVLMTTRGPVLADLELAGAGPVAHDLVAPVVAVERYGAPAADLAAYERTYGSPIPDAARRGPLRDAYELWLTAWAVANRHLDDDHELEARRRLLRWRDPDVTQPTWTLR